MMPAKCQSFGYRGVREPLEVAYPLMELKHYSGGSVAFFRTAGQAPLSLLKWNLQPPLSQVLCPRKVGLYL